MRNYTFLFILIVSLLCNSFCKAQSGNIYTTVGTGVAGFAGDGGLATAAKLNSPTDVFKDQNGNLFIADRNNNRIRKVNTAGIISTVVGNGTAGYTGDGGLATAAELKHPNGVAVDYAGNIYIADESNNVIRMVNTAGIISTIAGTGTAGFSGDGGPATSAMFNDPQAVAVDLAGNIYVADNNNSRVRKINTAGIISTYAGGGGVGFTVDGVSATSVSLCNIHDVSVDHNGIVYFTNQGCWHFLRVTTAGLIYNEAGAASPSFSGDCGPADSADIQTPYGIYPDNLGNVYLCPRGNIRVRKVNGLNYIKTVVGTGIAGYTGDGGPAISATVSTTIYGVFADSLQNIYFADEGNNVIRNFTSSAYSDTLNLPLCTGGTDTLHDSIGGGIWTSSNTSVATIGSSNGVLTGVGAGTSTITYTNPACPALFLVSIALDTIAGGPGGSVCVGATLPLTDTGTGIWSSGSLGVATVGSLTGVVTGVSAGTAVITHTYTSGGGCYSIATVTVNPMPTAILGSNQLCVGSTTLLSDAAGGGTWVSSNTLVGTIGTDGTVTGMSAGTTTITYSLGSCYVTRTITVNTQPVAITGNAPICQTFSITLSDATAGGVWSSVVTTVAAITAGGMVTGGAVGTSTISYTIGACFVTTVVTVNTQPAVITGAFGICQGATTSLTDATGGGTWSSSNGGVAGIGSGGIVTGSTVGTSVITYEIGSCYVTQVVTVNTQPVAITGNGPICNTFSITLSDATSGGVWASVTTSVAVITAGGGVVTGVGVGTSTISYTIGSCYVTTVVTVNTQPAVITGTFGICQGATTLLTDVTSGGVWSSSNGGVAGVGTGGVVTGGAVGTAIITYAIGSCYATQEVTVNTQPVAITGNTPVCETFTRNLSDATGGGTWSSVTGTVGTISVSGVVTGIGAGTTVISYTIGSCYVTTIVTVDTQPAAISGTLGVCLGLTTSLSDVTGGGVWSSIPATTASVTGTGMVTGVATGTATISYTLGICAATAIATVCPAATITLSDGTFGGTWSSSNSGVATVGSLTGIVTGVASGTTNISYILGTGCDVTYTITVNVAPSPVITPLGDTTFCPGGFVALTANTGAGITYQWYVGGVPLSGALSSSYIATVGGSYQVWETNSIGCSTMSNPMLVSIDTAVAVITAGGSTSVCSGTTVTLNANTGVGLSYQWLLGGVSIAGAVGSSYTTTIAGDYSVIVSNTAGCSATSNVITISVLPSPTANVVLSGPLTFCQNSMVVMTADYAAGYTYQWYNSAGAITGANSVSYTATTAGSYYVVVTNGSGCTATSVTMVVVVNPLPNVAITASGPLIFCSGGSVTLSATAVAGDTYQWFRSGSPIAGATNSSYLATVSGGYRVMVTDPTTGCSDKTHADTVVTEVGTPVIVPVTPASFCWGGSALLTTSVIGAAGTVNYQWYFNGVIITGATNSSYNATAPGNYSCQIAIPGSCTITTVAIPVTEYPLPNPLVSFDGTYIYTGSYYVTYQWYKDLVAIAGATTYHTNSLGSGDYKVAVTDTNGCQSYSDVFVYSGGATTLVGSTQLAGNNVDIFPNPVNDELTIKMDKGAYTSYTITNNLGQEMQQQALTHTSTKVDVSRLPAGLYYITFRGDNGGSEVRKFVKM